MANAARAAGYRVTLARLVAPTGAIAAAAIALLAIVQRWQEGRAVGEVVMVPYTALGVLLAAAALLWLRRPGDKAAARLGSWCAAAAIALGLAVVALYAAEWTTGTVRRTPLERAEWWSGRPGPVSGLVLVLVGLSLLALHARLRGARRWTRVLAPVALVIAFTQLVGHVLGSTALYGATVWGGTAMPTAVAVILLALGVIFADPSRRVAAVAASDSTGGHVLRRLVPAALLAPILLGWLTLSAQKAGTVDAPLATAVLAVGLATLLVGLAIRQATLLHVAHAQRERLLERERQARERVTQILESITDGFFAVDREWRFSYVNREAERLLRRPREDLIGRNLWVEFPASELFQRHYHRAMERQETVRFEEHYGPLGIWVDVSAFPSANGLSVYFHDITARKHAEEQLRESEERYRLLADMIPQHIWTTDRDGYHTYFSRRWYDYTGASADQTRGDGWLHLLHPDDRQRTVERWHQSLRTGEPYSVEYRFRGVDGQYRWFWGQAVAMRNESGAIDRWFGTLTDITQRKQLEEERERLLQRERAARAEADWRRAELERVTESRARLVRGFSHDLRNPLAAADGNAMLLEDGRAAGPLNEKQRERVLRIRRSIRSSLRLIDDLLELARAEAGQIELQTVDTDAGRAAREMAEDFHAQGTAAGLALEVRAQEGILARADPARLRQIVANLLSNAVKYAPGARVTIDAQLRRSGPPGPGPWVALSVADTGPGIPPDKRELIFQEYTRLDPQAQQGAGIGLAISQRIARLMGGDLTVESEAGRGSNFILWLPPGAAPGERGETPGETEPAAIAADARS